MKKAVKISYSKDPYNLEITYGTEVFDATKINNIDISQWIYPFMIKGVKWNGIYEELKQFTGKDDFVIHFNSSEDNFELLRNALNNTPVKVVDNNNLVVIFYKEDPFVTKITVNGEIFDTEKIQNRSIEEWINPIKIRNFEWNGIFKELEDYIGIDEYMIQFSGNQEFLNLLFKSCPETVSITYRSQISSVQPSKATSDTKEISSSQINNAYTVPATNENTNKTDFKIPKAKEISDISRNVANRMKQEISDEEIEKNAAKLPIKNKFISNNIMAICAAITIILGFLPFCGFSVTATAGEVQANGQEISASVFNALFGIDALKAIGSNKTFFALFLFLIPILIIVMNYIKQFKPFRRIISIFAPILGIVFEFITVFSLRSTVKSKYFDSMLGGASADTLGVKFNTNFKIGFWLILASFILTGIVGFISYYGMNTFKKSK